MVEFAFIALMTHECQGEYGDDGYSCECLHAMEDNHPGLITQMHCKPDGDDRTIAEIYEEDCEKLDVVLVVVIIVGVLVVIGVVIGIFNTMTFR